MEFHISRSVREQIDLSDLLFSCSGNVIFANVTASRKLAAGLQSLDNRSDLLQEDVNAAALFAMGLIDELSHALIAAYREKTDPLVLDNGLKFLSEKVDSKATEKLLLAFTEEFPNVAVFRNELSAEAWLTGHSEGTFNRELALEELLCCG